MDLAEKAAAVGWMPGEMFTELEQLRAQRQQLAAVGAVLSRQTKELRRQFQALLTRLAE